MVTDAFTERKPIELGKKLPTPPSEVKELVPLPNKCDASVHKENQSLVGSKIKMWWPQDKEFYKGVIESYDPDTKKHKIIYDDGDVESVVLKNEIYILVDSDSEKTVDNQSSQKAEGSSSKHGTTSKDKNDSNSKAETPAAELSGDTTTPITSKKSNGKATVKRNKSNTPKSSIKLTKDAENVTPEASKKSKDETPKAGKSKTGAPEHTTPKTEPIKSKNATTSRNVTKPEADEHEKRYHADLLDGVEHDLMSSPMSMCHRRRPRDDAASTFRARPRSIQRITETGLITSTHRFANAVDRCMRVQGHDEIYVKWEVMVIVRDDPSNLDLIDGLSDQDVKSMMSYLVRVFRDNAPLN